MDLHRLSAPWRGASPRAHALSSGRLFRSPRNRVRAPSRSLPYRGPTTTGERLPNLSETQKNPIFRADIVPGSGPSHSREPITASGPQRSSPRNSTDRSARHEIGPAMAGSCPRGSNPRSGAEPTCQRILFSRNASDALGTRLVGSVEQKELGGFAA